MGYSSECRRKSRESQGRCRGMWGKRGLVVKGGENREGWWEGWRQGGMGLTQASDPSLQPEFPSASCSWFQTFAALVFTAWPSSFLRLADTCSGFSRCHPPGTLLKLLSRLDGLSQCTVKASFLALITLYSSSELASSSSSHMCPETDPLLPSGCDWGQPQS